MLTLPGELQARLDSGATTLCWCWRVTRADDAVFGFTEHDRDLEVNGETYAAATGFVPGALDQAAGLAAGQASIAGILDAASLSEDGLSRGIWDGAGIELYRVDWSDPALFVRVWIGELGEIRRGVAGFEADLTGPAHRLDRTIGRIYSRSCDAELGDVRCGVDLTDPAFFADGIVLAVTGGVAIVFSGLEGHDTPLFAEGRMGWTSGPNSGLSARITGHRLTAAGTLIELESAPPDPVLPGDTARLTAGCDKRLTTCRDRFANAVNFRGCPFMPGNDALVAAPASQSPKDGSSRRPLP